MCENPDEDTPRLVFADWLQEHGEEERAEFIRLQIEIAGLPDGKKKQTRQAREKKLLAKHKEKWASYLTGYGYEYRDDPFEFRRGFVERAEMDESTFAQIGDELFALTPLREVAFPEAEEFADLAKCKFLLRLNALDLTGARLTTEYFDTAKLLRSKYLANLTTLLACGHDDNGHLDAGGMKALAETTHLTRLERLDLSDNWMFGTHQYAPRATACRKALVKLGENKPALRELRLHNIGLLDGDVSGFVGQPWVSRLRVLDLSGNGLAESGCRALCDSKHLANLERLDLSGNEYHDPEENTLTPLSPAVQRMLKKRFGKRVKL